MKNDDVSIYNTYADGFWKAFNFCFQGKLGNFENSVYISLFANHFNCNGMLRTYICSNNLTNHWGDYQFIYGKEVLRFTLKGDTMFEVL